VWLAGKTVDLDAVPPSAVLAHGALDVVVDRLTVRESERGRVARRSARR